MSPLMIPVGTPEASRLIDPLTNIETVKNLGTLFYFPRSEPIKDGQVTFDTKMGPIEVKCRFTVKEMMYRGKLEL